MKLLNVRGLFGSISVDMVELDEVELELDEVLHGGLVLGIHKFFFIYISKERGQALRGNIDIPTKLAPRETSILCRQTLEIYLKKGGK